MHPVKAYAVENATSPLKPLTIQRREPKETDVVIDIAYCGICHSDVHQARNEWNNSTYPMVPGHEIVGTVRAIGSAVSRFNVGDKVGVGCLVDSCRTCSACHDDLEQFCENGFSLTYNGVEQDKSTPTLGGYSKEIVVDENYVLQIPANLPLNQTAPLLCAGITTYSPLRHWKVKAGDKVAVVGLGGLGHMAIKIAVAMGCDVTVLSTSEKKREDALRLGAKQFVNTDDGDAFSKFANTFDFILNTAAGNLDLAQYILLLKREGTLVCVGAPEKPSSLNIFPLIMGRRHLAGSLIGGIKETQEMLDFCGKHHITADIELIPIHQVNEAYERMLKSDVKYRFVIDLSTLE